MKKVSRSPLVIWDWNGTLVDDAFIFVDIMNGFLSSYGLKQISLDDYRAAFCFPVHNYWSSLGFRLSQKEFRVLSVEFIRKYKKKMFKPPLKADILTVLEYLDKKNYLQLIVSAQEQSLLNSSVDYYNIKKYFSGVFGLKNNFAESKSALALSSLASFVTEESSLLVIGDTEHDLEVARHIKADCCLVSWGHNSSSRLSSLGCFVASSPEELLSFFQSSIKS